MPDEVETVVYRTCDYSKFKRLDENRSLTAARLAKLIASFSVKEIINPIIVNPNMQIIDGQGRFDAKKALGRPIFYIIDQNANIDDCRRMNMYNTPWSIYNFIESYAKAGNESYVRFKRTIDELKLPTSRALRFANIGAGNENKRITSGKLVYTEEHDKLVRYVKKCADEIASALGYTMKPNDAFYTAVKVMTETDGYNHKFMLSNCKQYRNGYAQASGLENELKELSRIYNYKKPAKSRIYFEDYMRKRGSNVRGYEYMDGEQFRKDTRGDDVSTI